MDRPPLKSNKISQLLISQFFGAFNDNAWKLMVTFLGIEGARLQFSGSTSDFESIAQVKTSIAFSALTIPLILFSIPGGWLADRFSKRSVIIGLKWVEILIMSCGAFSAAFAPQNFPLLVSVLVLLGIHSSLFSPSKYGILAELVPYQRLTHANSQLELWTFLAIIFGTACGGLLLHRFGGTLILGGFALVGLSITGLIASFFIPKVAPANESIRWKEGIATGWKIIINSRVLYLSILGSVFFWGLASLLGQNVVVYGKVALQLADSKAGLPLALCGLGVGLGSLVVAKLSGPRIRYGLIPTGCLALAVSIFTLALLRPEFYGVAFLMFMIGIASAFMVVPMQAAMQWHSPDKYRGAVLSLANVFTFSGVFVGTFLTGTLGEAGFSTIQIFYGSSFACLFAATASYLIKLSIRKTENAKSPDRISL